MHALELHYDRVGRFFASPKLKAAFTFQVGLGRIVVSEIEVPNLLEIWYKVDER